MSARIGFPVEIRHKTPPRRAPSSDCDADRIAKSVNTTGASDQAPRKRLILPGHVAVLLGEVEEALPGWQIEVGPREAVDLPGYLKIKP